jgi:hypothetical protein
MMKKKHALALGVLLPLLTVLGVGCEKEGPAEEAGEAMDNATENAGDAMEDAGDKAEDAADDAAH